MGLLLGESQKKAVFPPSHFDLNNDRLPMGVELCCPHSSFPLVPTDSLIGIWDGLIEKP